MSIPPTTVSCGDNLVLIGPMGAGKSSVARELARMTSRRWLDTDRLVVQNEGRNIPEIFAVQGENHFRALESEALRSLTGQQRLIVATGGGIVTRPENLPLLRALGCVVFLTASTKVLFERVSRNRNRPLLHTPDPQGTLGALVAHRHEIYTACAHVTVDSSTGTHAEVAAKVLARAREFYAADGAGAGS